MDCTNQEAFPKIEPPPGSSAAVRQCYLDRYNAFLAACQACGTNETCKIETYSVYAASVHECDNITE